MNGHTFTNYIYKLYNLFFRLKVVKKKIIDLLFFKKYFVSIDAVCLMQWAGSFQGIKRRNHMLLHCCKTVVCIQKYTLAEK